MCRPQPVARQLTDRAAEVVAGIDSHPRKGRATINIGFVEKQDNTHITIRISGYGAIVELLQRKLNEEIEYLRG